MRPLPPPDRPPLLFVVGWGRSGSTLLANLLGTSEQVFNAGELRWLWQRGLVEGRRCGCGEPLPSCPVWGRVLTRMESADPASVDPSVVVPLQDRYAVVRHTPRLLATRPDEGRRRYTAILRTLLDALAAETGATLVVDSSKRPCDARLLQEAQVDVHLALLVRDPRAVAYSWSRPRSRDDRADGTADLMARVGPGRSTYRWLQRNLLAELVMAATPPGRRRRLAYEQLVDHPSTTLETLASWLPQLTDTARVDHGKVELGVQHTVSGNPSRFRTGPVQVRRDDRWVGELPAGARRTVTALGWPLMLRYGYPLAGP